VDDDGRTRFVLSALRAFTRPTVTEGCEPYYGPKDDADARLEYEWVGRRRPGALLEACTGIPTAELCALSLRARSAVWSPNDWYDVFVDCLEITHVLAYAALAESFIDEPILSPGHSPDTGTDYNDNVNVDNDNHNENDSDGGDDSDINDDEGDHNDNEDGDSRNSDRDGPPLFQKLVSLTLVGVDLLRSNEWGTSALYDAVEWRQAQPLLCATTLDRIELRARALLRRNLKLTSCMTSPLSLCGTRSTKRTVGWMIRGWVIG